MGKFGEKLAAMSEEKCMYMLSEGVEHIAKGNQTDRLHAILVNMDYLQAKLEALGIVQLTGDYDLPTDKGFKHIQSALRNASHIVTTNPDQLGVQLCGWLLQGADRRKPVGKLLTNIKTQSDAAILLPLRSFESGSQGALLRTLLAHNNNVEAVAISNDLQFLASSTFNEIKVWKFETGELLHTLIQQKDQISQLAITPDNKRLVSASDAGSLFIWEIQSGTLLQSADGHGVMKTIQSQTPDGVKERPQKIARILDLIQIEDAVLTASADQSIILWDLETGKRVHRYFVPTSIPTSLVMLPDQTSVAVGLGVGEVWRLSLKTKTFTRWFVATTDAHFKSVDGLVITSDEKRLITLTAGGVIRVWDIQETPPRMVHQMYHQGALKLSLTSDDRILTGGLDKALRLSTIQGSVPRLVPDAHNSGILSITVSADGQYGITGGMDKIVRVWRLADISSNKQVAAPTTGNNLAAKDGHMVYSFANRSLHVWDPFTNNVYKTVQVSGNPRSPQAVSLNGKLFASTYVDQIQVFDVDTGTVRNTITLEKREHALSMAFAADNRSLYVGFNHGMTFEYNYKDPNSSQLDSSLINTDNLLKEYDLQTNQVRRKLIGHIGAVRALLVLPDGKRLISTGADDQIIIWHLSDNLTNVKWTAKRKSGMALAQAGNLMVTGGSKGVGVWDINTQENVCDFHGHTDTVMGVAISPNGKLVASVSKDRTLRIWNVERKKPLTYFMANSGLDEVIALENNTFAISGGDVPIHVFELAGTEPSALPPSQPLQKPKSQLKSTSQMHFQVERVGTRRTKPAVHPQQLIQVQIQGNIDMTSEPGKVMAELVAEVIRGHIGLSVLTTKYRDIIKSWTYQECKQLSDYLRLQLMMEHSKNRSVNYMKLLSDLTKSVEADARQKYPRKKVTLEQGQTLELPLEVATETPEGQVILDLAQAVEVDQPTLSELVKTLQRKLDQYDLVLLEQYVSAYSDFLKHGSPHLGHSSWATTGVFLANVRARRDNPPKAKWFSRLFRKKH